MMKLSANGSYQNAQQPSGFSPVDVTDAATVKRIVANSDYSPCIFSPLTEQSKVWRDNEAKKGTEKFRDMTALLGKPYRANEHWVSSDFYYMDVDRGMSIAEFQAHPDFQDVAYIIITSRNHQKPKGAEPACDRYHVLFPVMTITDRAKLERGLQGIVTVYAFADAGAKDAARFYFAARDTKVIWHDGAEFCPPIVPEVFQDDMPDFSTLTDKPRPEYKWNKQQVYGNRPDKHDMIMDALRASAQSGNIGQYQDWIRLGIAMKQDGYSESDWHELLCIGKPSDSATLKDYEYKWESFVPDGRAGGGTLMHFARLAVPDLLKATIKPSLAIGSAQVPNVSVSQPQGDPDQRQPRIRHISSMTAKATEWIINGYLAKQSYSLIFGESGHYKSFVSIEWAFCVAAGLPWNGHEVKQGPVLYIFGEGGSGLRRRFDAVAKKHGKELDSIPLYYDNNPPAMIDMVEVIEHIKAILLDMPEVPSVIIIDTLNTAFGDGNENATEDMTAFNRGNHQFINQLGATVVLVHHSGLASKDRSRGNSALKARLDHEYQCVKDEESKTMVMTNKKMKDDEPPEPICFEFRQVELGHHNLVPVTSGVLHKIEMRSNEMVHKLSDQQQRIIELVDKSPNGIGVVGISSTIYGINHTQANDNSIKQMLKRMATAGLINRIRNGLYGPEKRE
jgi:hypothetical protein